MCLERNWGGIANFLDDRIDGNEGGEFTKAWGKEDGGKEEIKKLVKLKCCTGRKTERVKGALRRRGEEELWEIGDGGQKERRRKEFTWGGDRGEGERMEEDMKLANK